MTKSAATRSPFSRSQSYPSWGSPRNLETQVGEGAELVRKMGGAEAGWGWGEEETGHRVRKGTFWGFVPIAVWLRGK